MSETNSIEDLFGPVISAYTRKQAIEDGQQVEVTETAREAGIKFRTFLTRAVWDAYVTVPPKVLCQDESGRLWDILWMMRVAVSQCAGGDSIRFQLHVRNDNHLERTPPLVTLHSVCAALDIDDPAPSITIMLPEED